MSSSQAASNFKFQVMSMADLEDIMLVERASHAHPWSIGIFKDCLRVGYYCPVLREGDKVISYGVMSVAVEEAHIFNVCVSPEYRRQRFGLHMMEHLLKMAKEKNAKNVFLEVRPSNNIAIQLYDKLGFSEVGVRKDYYPKGQGREDALVFAVNLFK